MAAVQSSVSGRGISQGPWSEPDIAHESYDSRTAGSLPPMADVVVVGGGHNGLVCAAYLARAGIDTVLIEARETVGGCASTVSDLGARFNICNCDHTMIRATPIIDDLDLAAHGLRYLEANPTFVNLFHDGSEPWVGVHDVDGQLDALAATHPAQVEAYRTYLADALPVAELIVAMARTHPGPVRIAAGVAERRARGLRTLWNWSRSSASEVLERYFDDWHMVMPAVSVGPTVWGVPPDVPGTGLAAASYALRHLVRTGRPQGGSGALTDALAASFVAAGGQVRTGSAVTSLILHDGAVGGVRTADGDSVSAPVVVAACDPQRVLLDWVERVPAPARRLIGQRRSLPEMDGYESKIDAVLTGLPTYSFAGAVEHITGSNSLEPTLVVSPSPAQLATAHAARSAGTVAEQPTMLINIPSVLDPAMITAAGEHVLSLEVLFTPYDTPGGWPGSPEPARWLELWEGLAGDGAAALVDRYRAMTPDRYEAEFSMHRGHTPSYAEAPLSALVGRRPELTRYRTPIEGLYLSGAATYPGAGVFGAAGRNAAHAVRRDLQSLPARTLVTMRHRSARIMAQLRR